MKLVLLGAPGAGKGTQATVLAKEYHIPHISTGHIIRNAIAEKTPVGLEAKGYIDRGELVPDGIVVEMVKERLKQDDCQKGYILDGFPRTISQAEIMDQIGILVDVVVEIVVDEHIIVDRLSKRRECKACGATYHLTNNPPQKDGVCDECGSELSQRADDVPETIKHRLNVYKEQTEPLKGYYEAKGNLLSIVSKDQISATTEAILAAIRESVVEA